jgi:glycosyltransferase involved in cell wall biosynthesis
MNCAHVSLDLVYHYFALYRQPVLSELARVVRGKLDLVADIQSNQRNLKLIDPAFCSGKDRCEWTVVKNRWFGPLLWQRGLLKHVLTSPNHTAIFLGQLNFLSTWVAILICRIRRKQTFFWTHGIYGNEGFLKLQLRLLFYRLADGLLLYGHHAKNLLIQEGFSADRLHVIYNSLDHEAHVRLRETITPQEIEESKCELFPEHSTAPIAIFIGRLVPSKKLELLIRAVHACGERGRVVNALIIGDGPGKEEWMRLAAELGVAGQVNFRGECHDEAVLARLLSLGTVCVSPGSVGLTAMHVMAYGVPVITHDGIQDQKPEFEAITEGETGGFFKRDDLAAIVDKLLQWVDQDPESKAATAQKCIDVIRKFYSPEVQVEQIAKAISSHPRHGNVPAR